MSIPPLSSAFLVLIFFLFSRSNPPTTPRSARRQTERSSRVLDSPELRRIPQHGVHVSVAPVPFSLLQTDTITQPAGFAAPAGDIFGSVNVAPQPPLLQSNAPAFYAAGFVAPPVSFLLLYMAWLYNRKSLPFPSETSFSFPSGWICCSCRQSFCFNA